MRKIKMPPEKSNLKNSKNWPLIEALGKANELSMKVASVIQEKINKPDRSFRLEPINLISKNKRVIPLEKTDGNELYHHFKNFFADLQKNWGPIKINNKYIKADWLSIILRNIKPNSTYFPFLRYGGSYEALNEHSDYKAEDLIGKISNHPERDEKIFLLSDIGMTAEAPVLKSIGLSICSEIDNEDMAQNDPAYNCLKICILNSQLVIKMEGPDWASLLKCKPEENFELQVKQILNAKAPEHCKIIDRSRGDPLPSIFREANDSKLLSKLASLALLYYFHLSEDLRKELSDNARPQMHIVWYLCPFFGSHIGSGGICEVFAATEACNIQHAIYDDERSILMRSIATVLMSGFENALLYQASQEGEDTGIDHAKRTFAHQVIKSANQATRWIVSEDHYDKIKNHLELHGPKDVLHYKKIAPFPFLFEALCKTLTLWSLTFDPAYLFQDSTGMTKLPSSLKELFNISLKYAFESNTVNKTNFGLFDDPDLLKSFLEERASLRNLYNKLKQSTHFFKADYWKIDIRCFKDNEDKFIVINENRDAHRQLSGLLRILVIVFENYFVHGKQDECKINIVEDFKNSYIQLEFENERSQPHLEKIEGSHLGYSGIQAIDNLCNKYLYDLHAGYEEIQTDNYVIKLKLNIPNWFSKMESISK